MIDILGAKFLLRFWSKVKIGVGCWIWTGATSSDGGHGVVSIGGRTEKANRVAWFLRFGPPGCMHVLHSCDNPQCVRPSHLWLGTNADNIRDRMRKGRLYVVGKRPRARRGEARVQRPGRWQRVA